ncbi:hypothetical protein [Flavobacterium lacus]|uniref:YhhN-like protein n=1 Tax=Flavobacterium lacus TaxID=1353778 RepID=A0A328X0V5_9FLAO|nr:hypothetical protein [Flavobacterium lacus]RAR49048.1 hypothetical protein B0I10_104189 [Flavobacterium lacus]
MKTASKLISSLTGLFFLVVGVLAYGVYFDMESVILYARVMAILLVFFIYFLSSFRKNKRYLISLLFSLLSILFLFLKSDIGVLAATLFFLIFIVLITQIVIKNTNKISFIPVILGFLPFLSILFYLIFLTYSSLGLNYVPSIINALIISFLGGLAVSNFVLEEDNMKNIWLLISTLLFILLIFVFMIEKYYLSVQVFKPIRTISFFGGHYLFMRYLLLCEYQTIIALPFETTEESVSK